MEPGQQASESAHSRDEGETLLRQEESESPVRQEDVKTLRDSMPWYCQYILPGFGDRAHIWHLLAVSSGAVPIWVALSYELVKDPFNSFDKVIRRLFYCVEQADQTKVREIVVPSFFLAGVCLSLLLPLCIREIQKISTDKDIGQYYAKLEQSYTDIWPTFPKRRRFYFTLLVTGNVLLPIVVLAFFLAAKGALAVFGVALFTFTSVSLHSIAISATMAITMTFFCLHWQIQQLCGDPMLRYCFDCGPAPEKVTKDNVMCLLRKYMVLEKEIHCLCGKVGNLLRLLFALSCAWVLGFFTLGILLSAGVSADGCGGEDEGPALSVSQIVAGIVALGPSVFMAALLFIFASHTALLTEDNVESKSLRRAMLGLTPCLEDSQAYEAYDLFLQYCDRSKSGVYLWPVGVFTQSGVVSIAAQFFSVASGLYVFLSAKKNE